eukprot:1408103-Rhodomonas_salina.1
MRVLSIPDINTSSLLTLRVCCRFQTTLSEEERIVTEAIIEGENPEIALARALQREEEERAREAEEEARASGGGGWGWVQRLKFWKKQVERGAEEREARAQKPVPKGWRAWIGLGGKGEEQERVEEEGAMVEVAITGEAERASLLGRSAMGLRWVGGGGHVDDGLEAAIAVTAGEAEAWGLSGEGERRGCMEVEGQGYLGRRSRVPGKKVEGRRSRVPRVRVPRSGAAAAVAGGGYHCTDTCVAGGRALCGAAEAAGTGRRPPPPHGLLPLC